MDLSAGIVLILIGIISYVLPLLGVQFLIVDVINTLTFGLGGIICIVIGCVLLFVAVRGGDKDLQKNPLQFNSKGENKKE
jgi:hypothetical protein